MMSSTSVLQDVSSAVVGDVAVVYAGDYLNKISGERIEFESRLHLSNGHKFLVINFRETKIVNSIGISILIGVIEAAKETDSQIVFAEANEQTKSLFDMLGLTRHVSIVQTEEEAIASATVI
jgi:anti-anti-sigma regulatory factor